MGLAWMEKPLCLINDYVSVPYQHWFKISSKTILPKFCLAHTLLNLLFRNKYNERISLKLMWMRVSVVFEAAGLIQR